MYSMGWKARAVLERVLDGEEINGKKPSPREVIDVAKFTDDKAFGKAIQHVHQTNQNVEINENTPDDVLQKILNG